MMGAVRFAPHQFHRYLRAHPFDLDYEQFLLSLQRRWFLRCLGSVWLVHSGGLWERTSGKCVVLLRNAWFDSGFMLKRQTTEALVWKWPRSSSTSAVACSRLVLLVTMQFVLFLFDWRQAQGLRRAVDDFFGTSPAFSRLNIFANSVFLSVILSWHSLTTRLEVTHPVYRVHCGLARQESRGPGQKTPYERLQQTRSISARLCLSCVQ